MPMISEPEFSKPIILLGGGAHAKVVIDALRNSNRNIIGLTDPNLAKGSEYFGVKVLGEDEAVFKYSAEEVMLVNSVGSIINNNLRFDLDKLMKKNGYKFTQVIHPSVVIAHDVKIEQGAQIMAGVIIQPGVCIGESSIINSGVIVEHDCIISDNCHLAPGVTLSGNVKVGERTHIGTGTSVIQDIIIAKNCLIAAGSVIYKDIPADIKYIQQRSESITEKV